MRVGCIICSDSFSTFVDVASIPCGHTFHSYCLLQWIEKSKSCPTCRQKATCKNVQKLYFDATGNDDSQIDPDSLRNQIDSLKFQVLEKTQHLKNIQEDNDTFKKQTKGLRLEVTELEKKQRERDTTISAYKQQIRHFDSLIKTASKAEEEARSAKSELELLKRVKVLLEDNSVEIEDIILSNSNSHNVTENIRNLATISSVLKSRVNKLSEERRKAQDENHSLLLKLKDAKKSFNSTSDKLLELQKDYNLQREDLQSLERENESLQKKVSKLQDAIASPSADVKNSVIQRLIAESPAPFHLKRRAMDNQEDDTNLTPDITRKVPKKSSAKRDLPIPTLSFQDEATSVSPYLPVKSASIAALNSHASSSLKNALQNSNKNIFKDGRFMLSPNAGTKSKSFSAIPVFAADDVGYDGLGGHHKVDYFPNQNSIRNVPIKKKSEKPLKVINGKGSAPISSRTIKDFFKDPFAD